MPVWVAAQVFPESQASFRCPWRMNHGRRVANGGPGKKKKRDDSLCWMCLVDRSPFMLEVMNSSYLNTRVILFVQGRR